LFSRFPLAAGTKLFSGNKGIFKFFVSKFLFQKFFNWGMFQKTLSFYFTILSF